MSKSDLDIENIIKEAIIENFDMDAFVNSLSENIHNSNVDWWVRQVVNPIRETLEKAILENKDIIKYVIEYILDREYPYKKIEKILEKKAEERISALLPKVKIKMEVDNVSKN